MGTPQHHGQRKQKRGNSWGIRKSNGNIERAIHRKFETSHGHFGNSMNIEQFMGKSWEIREKRIETKKQTQQTHHGKSADPCGPGAVVTRACFHT